MNSKRENLFFLVKETCLLIRKKCAYNRVSHGVVDPIHGKRPLTYTAVKSFWVLIRQCDA